jgi:hypothetical protein
MVVSQLPEEIILQILSYLKKTSYNRWTDRKGSAFSIDRATLCSAARVSRAFERIAVPLLYNIVTTTHNWRAVSECHLLVRTLLAKPERAGMIQTIVAGAVGSDQTLMHGEKGQKTDLLPYLALLMSMRSYLETDPFCCGISDSMLASQDVALMMLLKLCTSLKTLDLDLWTHDPRTATETQTSKFLQRQAGRVLPRLCKLTLHKELEEGFDTKPCFWQFAHLLLLPQLRVFTGRQLDFGRCQEAIWRTWLRQNASTNIRECYLENCTPGGFPLSALFGIMPQLEILHVKNTDDVLEYTEEAEAMLRELARLATPLRELRFDACNTGFSHHISTDSLWCSLAKIHTLEIIGISYDLIQQSCAENGASDDGPLTFILPWQNLHTLQIRDCSEWHSTAIQHALQALMGDTRYHKLCRIELQFERDYWGDNSDLPLEYPQAMLAPGWSAIVFTCPGEGNDHLVVLQRDP